MRRQKGDTTKTLISQKNDFMLLYKMSVRLSVCSLQILKTMLTFPEMVRTKIMGTFFRTLKFCFFLLTHPVSLCSLPV